MKTNEKENASLLTEKESELEGLVRRDMEERNRRFGYKVFDYRGFRKEGSFWEIVFRYSPQRNSPPREISYGGFPLGSKLGVLKAYLEDCR